MTVEPIVECWKILRDEHKFAMYAEELIEEEKKKSALQATKRPAGNKKAKKLAETEKLCNQMVEKVVAASGAGQQPNTGLAALAETMTSCMERWMDLAEEQREAKDMQEAMAILDSPEKAKVKKAQADLLLSRLKNKKRKLDNQFKLDEGTDTVIDLDNGN